MGAYAEKYKHLHARYAEYHNFDAIAAAMEGYFSDIFQLDELDLMAESMPRSRAAGSYLHLFDLCMEQLRPPEVLDNPSLDLSMPGQVVKKLDHVLRTVPEIKNFLLGTYIFKPAHQIGFMEKMATGELAVGEPLTLLDMRRALNGLKTIKRGGFPDIEAVHLRNLPFVNAKTVYADTNNALLVDFNLDPRHKPKWGVLDLQNKQHPRVFCESPLRENEMKALETAFELAPTAIEYIPAKSDSPASSGYAAIAWLSSGQIRNADAWNFNVDADFGVLVHQLNYVFWGGEDGLTYRNMPGERKHFSPGFKYVVEKLYPTHAGNDSFTGGFPGLELGAAAMAGKVGGERVKIGDLTAVINETETQTLKAPAMDRFYAYRAYLPGFSDTLARYVQHETPDQSKLVLDGNFTYSKLESDHYNYHGVGNASLIENARRVTQSKGKYRSNDDFGVALLVLGLVRFQAKKRVLTLSLHNKFQLDQEDSQFVIGVLNDNAHVTELRINETGAAEYNNASLEHIHAALMPTLARNRWLHANGYLPPMVDNYWKKAAFYWLTHLYQDLDVLSLTNPSEKNKLFKRCIQEMGLQGLDALLAYLGDPGDAETIRNVYGTQKPAFYVACQPAEFSQYLQRLVEYLDKPQVYFPFKELGVAYQPGNDERLAQLLGQINGLGFFERVTLTDCVQHKDAFTAFMHILIAQAAQEKWVGAIFIPELDDIEKVSIDLLPLRALYTRLNNTITVNRHTISAESMIDRLQKMSDFTLPAAATTTGAAPTTHIVIDPLIAQLQVQPKRKIGGAPVTYPMDRGGVQLQVQQQQQIQQEFQVQQEQQRVVINRIEEAIAGPLVDHTNINALLNGGTGCDLHKMTALPTNKAAYKGCYIFVESGNFFSGIRTLYYIKDNGVEEQVYLDCNELKTKLATINPLNSSKIHLTDQQATTLIQTPSHGHTYEPNTYFSTFVRESAQTAQPFNAASATLRVGSETILQGLFHTWVNANPEVDAPHAIHSMTMDAAKELLRKHRRLPSGLNPDNLPKGFYTQRSKAGQLILCYNPIQGYMRSPNPFTIDLDVRVPKAFDWEGDFTLFNLERYRTQPNLAQRLEPIDWDYIQLFALLQPENVVDDAKQSEAFISNYGSQLGLTGSDKSKITNNWKIFWQVWSFAGGDGFTQFRANNLTGRARLANEDARDLLCESLPEDLKDWLQTIPMDDNYLRALGQIYYRKGPAVMALFLRKLRRIDACFYDQDPSFFRTFNQIVIGCNPNFDSFFNDSNLFFTAMDNMVTALSTDLKQRGSLKVWKRLSANHMYTLGFDHVDKLWSGYAHFIETLKELDLTLEGSEFDSVAPGNMLVVMDRVLTCLQQIPDPEMKKLFLCHLDHFDLTHGGVYYAIKHEDFKYVDAPLKLHDFLQGTPTYRPELKDIYSPSKWTHANSPLQMKRALASQAGFDHEAYSVLTSALEHADAACKDKLILLIYTQYPTADIRSILHKLDRLDATFRMSVARALHAAVYQHGNHKPSVTLDAVIGLETFSARQRTRIDALFVLAPRGTVLEALSIQQLAKRWNGTDATADAAEQVLQLFEARIAKPNAFYPDTLYWDAYKLLTLFGITDVEQLNAFYRETANMPQFARLELERLITQLLSVNYEGDLSAITPPNNEQNWQALMQCIDAMAKNRVDPAQNRIEFLDRIAEQCITFKYSKSGDFRAIQLQDPIPAEVASFRDHEARLWKFLKKNIAVPGSIEVKDSLKPILRFMNGLQSMPRRYLNEIEPLLSSLEKTPAGHYWSTNYFYGLVMALQVPDQAFPISLLSMIIKEEAVAAKPIDDIEIEFPTGLKDILQLILKSKFARASQMVLCKIALMEYKNTGNNSILQQVMATLDNPEYANSQQYALEILAKSKDCDDLQRRFDNCKILLQHAGQGQLALNQNWSQTTQLWLRALSMKDNDAVEKLYRKIQEENNLDDDRQALILHIVAFSTLDADINNAREDKIKLNYKASKLVVRLNALSSAKLSALAATYPRQPTAQLDDILRLMKTHDENEITWNDCLDRFTRNPYPEPRADYADVAASREVDLQRMIAETRISAADPKMPISARDTIRLTVIFRYLKAYEQGEITLESGMPRISALNQLELATAFKDLSSRLQANPDDDVLRAQLWAVLFEVLSRTTHKYPHLAQQFALIANDICVTGTDSRVLQLSTGEGKSHFVALRAAMHAGQGKVVDICTAKRVLAERDLQDYASFFDYLGLTHAYIDPQSEASTYTDAQIHYSTMGDMSLFLDEQSFKGHHITEVKGLQGPIALTRNNRVGLFDEFDFIRFDEGRKTEYNYARPTGKTPKQMTWLYQAINRFYTDECSHLEDEEFTDDDGVQHVKQVRRLNGAPGAEITEEMLDNFAAYLQSEAGDNADRLSTLEPILRDPLQRVQWLQSAHQAHRLEWRINFTVREENIKVGDESYPMREIIPLSQDNQKMIGSTFSAGVQQLLAVRLNTEAKEGTLKKAGLIKDKSQNFHIHPESNIISSQVAAQRMHELWGKWEGFSGTISSAQAQSLNHDHGTQVLHVPTNQRDLRTWHDPKFYNRGQEARRYGDLVAQIRLCLHNKQSMLFACKNDQQVVDLKKILMGTRDKAGQVLQKGMLTEDEQKYFDFYTNEDPRPADKVLKDKEDKENWHGGQKKQGVGLVASGFGRGDNVGVEAVFLLDVSDTNDKLQKGGRTARNGAEGEVFQFYLDADLQAEEQRCGASLDAMLRLQEKQMPEVLIPPQKLSGEARSQAELRFEKLMLWREYEFSLQNIANQGYHEILAQFSTWVMDIFAQNELDIEQKEFLTRADSVRMQLIEKEWLNISTRDVSATEKILAIRAYIQTMAQSFYLVCDNAQLQYVPAFEPRGYQEPAIEPGVFQERRDPTATTRALSTICTVYTRLADIKLGVARLAKIASNITRLTESNNPILLQNFADKITFAESIEDFERVLAVDLSKLTGTSAGIMAQASQTHFDDYIDLFEQLDPNIRPRLHEVLGKLVEKISARAIADLPEADYLSADDRVLAAIPVYNYLSRFSPEQQVLWGDEYLLEIKTLFRTNLTPMQLDARLKATAPMSVSQLRSLWMVATRYSKNEAEFNAVLPVVARALQGSTEQRLRMLTQQSAWSRSLTVEEGNALFKAFSSSMEQFKEGVDWDVFINLVKNTQAWWHKGGEDAYTKELATLWQRLGARKELLSELSSFIAWSLKLPGKSSFQVLSLSLTLPEELLRLHHAQIQALWIALPTLKKRDKTERFTACLQGIEKFYALINTFSDQERKQMMTQLMDLPGAKLQFLMQFVSEHSPDLQAAPNALSVLLNLYSLQEDSLTDAASLQPEEERRLTYVNQACLVAIEHYKQKGGSIDAPLTGVTTLSDLILNDNGVSTVHGDALLEHIKAHSDVLIEAEAVTTLYRHVTQDMPLESLTPWVNVLTRAHRLSREDERYADGAQFLSDIFEEYKTTSFSKLTSIQWLALQTMIEKHLQTVLLHPASFEPILTYLPVLLGKKVSPESQRLCELLVDAQARDVRVDTQKLLNFVTTYQSDLLKLDADRFNYMHALMSEHHQALLVNERALALMLGCCQTSPMPAESYLDTIRQLLLQAAAYKKENKTLKIAPITTFMQTNRTDLLALNVEEFERFMGLMQDHCMPFIEHDEFYRPAFGLVLQLQHSRLHPLTELVLTTATSGVSGGDLDQEMMYSWFAQHKVALLALSSEKSDRFMRLMLDNQVKLVHSPDQYYPVLTAILQYQAEFESEPERFNVMTQLLLNLAAYQTRHDQIDIATILDGVERFKDSTAVLERLNQLVANDERYEAMALLFAEVPKYLDSPLLEPSVTQQQQVVETLSIFSKAAQQRKEKRTRMFTSASVRDLFVFTDGQLRNKRMMFMRALYEKAATEDESTLDLEGLESGFARYVSYAQQLLDKPSQADLHKKRDLSVDQQLRLLALTDELAYITDNEVDLESKPQTTTHLTALQKNMDHLVAGYSGAWFKSKERIDQLKALQAAILLDTNADAPNRYQSVLDEILRLKMDAMNKDVEVNRDRSWLKMNWSGQSRYLNTLNQLHDVVVRSWMSDVKAIESFHVYQDYNLAHFEQLIGHLSRVATDGLNDMKGQTKWQKRQGVFYAYEKHPVAQVTRALEYFEHHGQNAENVRILMRDLRKSRDTHDLPRYLTTVLDQVLMQGDAIAMHLGQQEQRRLGPRD